MSPLGSVVIDTSTLVGAVLRPASPPRHALMKAVSKHGLCVSQSTLQELQVVLNRRKFDRYAPLQTRMDFLALVTQWARLCEVDATSTQIAKGVCRDPKDDKFLALALACQATTIVSSDDDLLSLSSWQNINIVTSADFLLIEKR
jgi:putative PIN family toxin of toxin-antitoxin system